MYQPFKRLLLRSSLHIPPSNFQCIDKQQGAHILNICCSMRVQLPSKLFSNGTVWQCQILISDLNRWLARYHHHQCWAQRKPISIQMTGTPCPGKLHRYEGFFIGRFWQPGAWEAICFTCWKTALAAPPPLFLCWPKVSDRGFWNIDQLIFWFLIERIKSRFLLIGYSAVELQPHQIFFEKGDAMKRA